MTINVGDRYGHLTVTDLDFNENGWCWICRCDCGKIVVKPKASFNAIRPNSSCGCMRYKNIKKCHGYGKFHEYHGESHTIMEWAKILRCSDSTVRAHLERYEAGSRPIEYVFEPSSYQDYTYIRRVKA